MTPIDAPPSFDANASGPQFVTSPALTVSQAREVDRLAVERLGLPTLLLMENAAINAAAATLDLVGSERGIEPDEVTAVVLCGGGNNGGDGYAVARHLHNWGATVRIVTLKEPTELTGDAAINHHVCAAMGVAISPWSTDVVSALSNVDVVIDALLGTGFSGDLREPMLTCIKAINDLATPLVVSLDVPSGLDAQSGKPQPSAVRADLTVTFAANKVGFHDATARKFLGRVVIADIGVPASLIEQAQQG